jgi:hypothetical protein
VILVVEVDVLAALGADGQMWHGVLLCSADGLQLRVLAGVFGSSRR